ncbi:MAG: hypothetical protein AVDCRST_MAG91-2760 [uncultured Sphingomonadaceae bacterium]|uniref:Phytoene synthase n=1 Tax=uncultured Sphingomonadaceae bacterium TaxID=169976 RepID=A0A6J4TQ15_9SPHN|nr:MAG: hypothetical protein AVDCRST_MAG91-2760 [uncultured Sphingomonadaceae bacterium]
MTPLDPDRTLALSYVPAARRAAVGALWRLDAALGAALQGGREPLISQIKLVWWRDSLDKLDRQKPPAEPVLQEVAAQLLPKGLTGADLSALEAGWTVLLSQEPLTSADLDSYAVGRGGLLFRYSARLLGSALTSDQERGGEAWAFADLARHSNSADAEAALAAARSRITSVRWPSLLRPLGMLAALGARDVERGLDQLEPPGAPARMARMLRHRLTGR